MSKTISISLSEPEIERIVSGLLFFSSVNIVSDLNEDYQKDLVNIAIKLKSYAPNLKLSQIRFIKEKDYEDKFSETILSEFNKNMEITIFEEV